MAQQPEETILSEQGILVSNARIVTAGQTYAMANVVSITLEKKPGDTTLQTILLIGGFLAMMGMGFAAVEPAKAANYGLAAKLAAGAVVAAAVTAGSFKWMMSIPPICTVVLQNSAGMAKAVITRDVAFAQRVVDAVNNAMIARG